MSKCGENIVYLWGELLSFNAKNIIKLNGSWRLLLGFHGTGTKPPRYKQVLMLNKGSGNPYNAWMQDPL